MLKCHFLYCHLWQSHLLECCNMNSISHFCKFFSHSEFYGDTNIGKKCTCCLYFPEQFPDKAIHSTCTCWKKFHNSFIYLRLLASALQICTIVMIPNTCAEWLKSCFKPEAIVVNVCASHQALLFLPFNQHVILTVNKIEFQPQKKIEHKLKFCIFKTLC